MTELRETTGITRDPEPPTVTLSLACPAETAALLVNTLRLGARCWGSGTPAQLRLREAADELEQQIARQAAGQLRPSTG